MGRQEGEDARDHGGGHGAHQQGDRQVRALPQEPVEAGVEAPGPIRSAQQPGAELIVEVSDGRQGDRVGDPDHGDRDGQVEPDPNRGDGGQQHLPGYGDEGEKGADRQAADRRAPVEVPEPGIVEVAAEESQAGMFPDGLGIGKMLAQIAGNQRLHAKQPVKQVERPCHWPRPAVT